MWYPQIMSKYFSIKYLLLPKKLVHQLEPFKKLILGAPFGGFRGNIPKKTLRDKIAFVAQQLYAKIRFRCCVVKEKKSVQELGRKKGKLEEKKEKNLIAAKSGL